MKNGSTGGMVSPAPKLPLASRGWIVLMELRMQSLRFGTFRRQIGIVGAESENLFKIVIFEGRGVRKNLKKSLESNKIKFSGG